MPSAHVRLLLCWGLGLALLATAPACSGPGPSGQDTSAPLDAEAEAAKAKALKEAAALKKRTYTNSQLPVSDDEFVEIDRFCTVTLECRKRRCGPDEQARAFMKVPVKTAWGKALQRHFAGTTMTGAGRRLAKLVAEEELDRRSGACHEILARFD